MNSPDLPSLDGPEEVTFPLLSRRGFWRRFLVYVVSLLLPNTYNINYAITIYNDICKKFSADLKLPT